MPGPFDPAAGSASAQDGAGGLVGCRSRGGDYGNDATVAISLKVSFHISFLSRGSTRETKKELYLGGIVGGRASKPAPGRKSSVAYALFQLHLHSVARLFSDRSTNLQLDGQHVPAVAHGHE